MYKWALNLHVCIYECIIVTKTTREENAPSVIAIMSIARFKRSE